MSGQTTLCAVCRVVIEFDFKSWRWKDLRGKTWDNNHQHVDRVKVQDVLWQRG